MSTPISDAIARYEASRLDHRSGTIDLSVIRELERLLPSRLEHSMETGCGKTTILFSRLSARHLVFAFDDTSVENGSVEYFRACPDFDAARTTLVPGSTQRTLPSFEFTAPLDLACLDGPHGYPFPELEYYCVYPHLRPGAWLIVDDIHIPTIHRMYEFLKEDEMFALVSVVRTTAVFQRSAAPTFDPQGDGWWLQRFNASRFPIGESRGRQTADDLARRELEQVVERLRSELQQAREQENWWKHVAEERRLRTRVARRVERLQRRLGLR